MEFTFYSLIHTVWAEIVDKGTTTVKLRRPETLGKDRVHYGHLLLESNSAFDKRPLSGWGSGTPYCRRR